MTVAVTGATGSVGGAVVRDLEAAGHRVVPLARRPIPGRADTILWDLRDEYAGEGSLPRVEAIVHCAASLATADTTGDLHRANVDGTRRILDAWPRVPIVFVSSASVYPASRVLEGGRPLREDDATGEGLHDEYSRSKLEAERDLVEESRRSGRSVTILRASIVYGPGDRTILPRIRRLRLGRFAVIPGGRREWSMTPVELLSQAIRIAVESPPTGVLVLNAAEEPPERVRDLFRRLLEQDAGRRLTVIFLPGWMMWLGAAAVEAWGRVFRSATAPMVTRSAIRYLSEERILDLGALREFLGPVLPLSQNTRS